MPVSSRYSSSPETLRPPSTNLTTNVTFTLILIGTSALLVLLVVLITGGFVIDAGPLHFSSRRWTGPWAIAAAASLAAGIVGGRRSIANALAILDERIDRHAAAIAVVAAAATAGIGGGVVTLAPSAESGIAAGQGGTGSE